MKPLYSSCTFTFISSLLYTYLVNPCFCGSLFESPSPWMSSNSQPPLNPEMSLLSIQDMGGWGWVGVFFNLFLNPFYAVGY